MCQTNSSQQQIEPAILWCDNQGRSQQAVARTLMGSGGIIVYSCYGRRISFDQIQPVRHAHDHSTAGYHFCIRAYLQSTSLR